MPHVVWYSNGRESAVHSASQVHPLDVAVGGFPLDCGSWAPDAFDVPQILRTERPVTCQHCLRALEQRAQAAQAEQVEREAAADQAPAIVIKRKRAKQGRVRHPSIAQVAAFTPEQRDLLLADKVLEVSPERAYAIDWDYVTRRYAAAHGDSGALGGWIYNSEGRPICQGWLGYVRLYGFSIRVWYRAQLREALEQRAQAAQE